MANTSLYMPSREDLTSLKAERKSSLIRRLLLSILLRKFLRALRVFSVKKVDNSFNASNVS